MTVPSDCKIEIKQTCVMKWEILLFQDLLADFYFLFVFLFYKYESRLPNLKIAMTFSP